MVCTQFDFNAELKGTNLTVEIVSDLPPDTNVTFSVTRTYFNAKENELYSIDYARKRSKLSAWQSPHTFDVSNAKALRAFNKKQRELSRIGLDSDVRDISEDLEASVVIPMYQDNPRFGQKNQNLKGSCGHKGQPGWVTISREIFVRYPMKGKVRRAVFADPHALALGNSYELGSETVLMPEFDPLNPVEALERVIKLPASTSIRVEEMRLKRATRWYRVTARKRSGKRLGRGWINSIALLGQSIKRK